MSEKRLNCSHLVVNTMLKTIKSLSQISVGNIILLRFGKIFSLLLCYCVCESVCVCEKDWL